MPSPSPITIVAATNSRKVLEDNLLASPCFQRFEPAQTLVQEGFSSAGKAYNDAIDRSNNDLVVFVHQDVILPEYWLDDVERAIERLKTDDPGWGVLGCSGRTVDNLDHGYVYSSGEQLIGKPFERPEEIQTLDEILLILRKSSGLRFDDNLPNFHMYGTDICLTAAQTGRKSYAIPAFCIHNTQQTLVLPKEFYDCYWYVRRKWAGQLPIQTTCVRITKSNLPMFRRRLGEFKLRHVLGKQIGGTRAQDVKALLKEVDAKLSQKTTAHYCI